MKTHRTPSIGLKCYRKIFTENQAIQTVTLPDSTKSVEYLIVIIIRKTILMVLALLAIYLITTFRPDVPLEELKQTYALPDSSYMEIQGMPVHYRRTGTGPTIVLLHGTIGSLHQWSEWINKMSNHFDLVTLDLPAYGFTGPFPDGPYKIERYTNFLNEFLGRLKISKATLIGHSFGGYVAWRTAVRYPNLVDNLVLIASTGLKYRSRVTVSYVAKIPIVKNLLYYHSPRFIYEVALQKAFFPEPPASAEEIDRFYDLARRPGNRGALLATFNEMYKEHQEDLALKVSQPTLILWGEEDMIVPVEMGYKLHKMIPNSKFTTYPKKGHMINFTQVDLLLESVVPFITDHSNGLK
jgi:pimeloyl-ACP methyl ester carboxylesterase